MKNCTRREFIRNVSLGVLSVSALGASKKEQNVSTSQSLETSRIPSDLTEKNKIVVMSDIHLGVDSCVLNKDKTANIQYLFKQIEEHNPDELILLGDIFDFALCSLRKTCSNARTFFGELKERLDGLKVTYIPGNHDHHIWSSIIEREYFLKPLANGDLPEDMGGYMQKCVNAGPFKHVPFLDPFYSDLEVTYPHVIRTFGARKYYFTHGHLQDPLFKMGSEIVKPNNLAELEAFNSWFLEGIWFHMGQSGRFGDKIFKEIYINKSPIETFLIVKGLGGWLWGAVWGFVSGQLSPISSKEPTYGRLPYRFGGGVPIETLAVTEESIMEFGPFVRSLLPFTFVYGHTHEKHEELPLSVLGFNTPCINTGTWIKEDKKNNGFWVISEAENKWISFWG